MDVKIMSLHQVIAAHKFAVNITFSFSNSSMEIIKSNQIGTHYYVSVRWQTISLNSASKLLHIQGGSKKVSCCTVIDISIARQ